MVLSGNEVHIMFGKFKLKRNYFILLILAAFLLFQSVLLGGLSSDMIQLDNPVSFNDGWSLKASEFTDTVAISRTVTDEMLGNVVCFFAYDAFVDAFVDDEPIYHFGESHSYLMSPGSLWHMIDIPENSIGRTLTVEIRYAYDGKYTTEFDILLGGSGGVILTLLRREALDLSVNFLMLVLGVILCVIFALQLKNGIHSENCLYLGLLSLCFVFWTNNNLFFTQLIFPYSALQYFSYYFFLSMLPLLLMCYLETITDGLRFNMLFWIHLALCAAISFSQLSGIAEFTETLPVFLLYSGVEMVFVILRLVKNRKSHRNPLLVGAFIVMVVCILINAVLYLFSQTKGVSTTMAKLGISIYLIVSIYVSLSSVITDLAEVKHSKLLRKIAFTDSLTQVGNRYAFNYNINEIPLNDLSLFSLDINNLKYYNDTFGHACGDTLICEATKMLNEVFSNLYRTGGDEFIAVEIKNAAEHLQYLKDELNAKMTEYNGEGHDVLVEIACGYSTYCEGDVSYEDILKRADLEMYNDKGRLKKTSRIKSIR